jgi:hypothetical protein
VPVKTNFQTIWTIHSASKNQSTQLFEVQEEVDGDDLGILYPTKIANDSPMMLEKLKNQLQTLITIFSEDSKEYMHIFKNEM